MKKILFLLILFLITLQANIIPNGNYLCKTDTISYNNKIIPVKNSQTYIVALLDKRLIIIDSTGGAIELFSDKIEKKENYKIKTYIDKNKTFAAAIASKKIYDKYHKSYYYIFGFMIKGKNAVVEAKCKFINNKIQIEK